MPACGTQAHVHFPNCLEQFGHGHLYKIFESNNEFGCQCIDRLLESGNVVIKSEAAAYCLVLEYRVEEAETILRMIAENPDNGIFGFNAGMILKVWEKNGYLKIY